MSGVKMSHYLNSNAPHWYCHVEMDVVDAEIAKAFLAKQIPIEETNGMLSYEYFADDAEDPKKVVLLECFPDDDTQVKHLEELRFEQWSAAFANPKLYVYGNPPQSAIDRMAAAGFWPPAFAGEFRHMPYFMGFRKE
jgi:quinol monooxygenase YgiN